MNEKRAKRLRQLVRHLMNKAEIDSRPWISYEASKPVSKLGTDHRGQLTEYQISGSIRLDQTCGRALYQKMKKRDLRARG